MENKGKNWLYSRLLLAVIMFGITVIGCGNEDENVNSIDFSISNAVIISQEGIDLAGYFPDGKISIVKDNTTNKYISFWGEWVSYRTVANTPYTEDHISQIKYTNRVYGKDFDAQEGFNDGGSWFIGVHRLTDERLAGFFHAESHWSAGDGAYKSIGVTYSSDNGLTWDNGVKILNANYLRATTAEWGGLGDGCVVYNEEREQFIAYYSGDTGNKNFLICMAASSDPAGASGTWKKWDGNNFSLTGYDSVTGVGAKCIPIKGLQDIGGANPSVMWNSYLKKWIMVYHQWDPRVIYMSVSSEGLNWSTPKAITNANEERAWYPNLISEFGDTIGGQTIKLYYARFHDNLSTRDMVMRTITFN